MKFISITPTQFMQDALKSSDTTLVLAHLIDPEQDEYIKACLDFKKKGGKIIMDNSFYELRGNMALSELADRAKLIKADVLVLPDLPMRDNLRFMVRHSIIKIKEMGYKGKFMMCTYAGGENFQQDLAQFKILNSIAELDIIAIPYVFRESDALRRHVFLDMIEKYVGVDNIHKRIHLFGCNSFKNIANERRRWVHSIDGSMPWKVGYFKKNLPIKVEDEPKRPKDYFDIKKVSKEQQKYIDYNLKLIKEECEKI